MPAMVAEGEDGVDVRTGHNLDAQVCDTHAQPMTATTGLPQGGRSGWVSRMVRIIEVDPRDEAELRAFHDTEQAAIRHDRPEAVIRTWPAFLTLALTPSPYYRRTFLAAVDDGSTVGVADLGGSLGDNEHLADVEINVLADHRRQGVGRALWEEADRRRRADGRTSVCGEVCLPVGITPDTSAAYAFAEAMGFSTVHREDQLVLRLPVEKGHIAAVSAAVERQAASYEIVTWRNRCPDEYAAVFCEMKTTMNNDMPVGEMDYQPIVYDEPRLRTHEERSARSFDQLIAAARQPDTGSLVGYSQLYLPHGEDYVIQDDTLVMPDHRGHHLGTALKLTTLEILLREHPERSRIHTWTDPENLAMYRTNTALGFRVVERMHEMQRRDA
jgi:GNAT superfamily N-acetyltransferase